MTRGLLDTGEPALWTVDQRRHYGRCQSCERHPYTQGHHEYCPAAEEVAS